MIWGTKRPACFNPGETGGSAEVSRYAVQLEHEIQDLRRRELKLTAALSAARERLASVAFTEWETPSSDVGELAKIWRPKARTVVAQIDAALGKL